MKRILSLYDLVKSMIDINENIPSGTTGSVVFIYDNPELAYEIEFIDDSGNFLGLVTIKYSETFSQLAQASRS